jgi:hypothetical protein
MRQWPGRPSETSSRTVSASVVASVALMTGIALGQAKPSECKPEKVEGQIIKIEWDQKKDQGKLIMRGSDGKNYEFNASKEVLADKKLGDRLEVTKRMPATCQ